MTLKVLCWLFLGIIAYTYLGYTFILLLLSAARRLFTAKESDRYDPTFEPDVSLIIPAHNEAEIIEEKVQNCRELDYPKNKLQIFFVSDGSSDGTAELLSRHKDIHLLREAVRKGKVHAVNRCMEEVSTPVVILSDANAMLNPSAVREIVKFFSDTRVGCVAGEKRIASSDRQKAVSAGEGLYWQYESMIKSLESITGSVLGAAGELFAIRRELYKKVPEDTLLDDLAISMQIASEGFQIKYAPDAWSLESSSYAISDELKRKIRIASGGIQFLFRMPSLLNPLKHGFLTFKYISHKVLRWTLVPFGFMILLLSNIAVVTSVPDSSVVYTVLLIFQGVFYLMVIIGLFLKNFLIKIRLLFVPYYLFIMNYAVILGFLRYFTGKYSTRWPKARRSG